jgi:hypothetical protein
MSQQESPSVRERRMARELRDARLGAGLAGVEVATTLGWSASKVSRIETGRIGISPADLDLLVDLYQLPAEQAEYFRRLAPAARPAAGGTPTPIRCPPAMPGCCGWNPDHRRCGVTAPSCRIPC